MELAPELAFRPRSELALFGIRGNYASFRSWLYWGEPTLIQSLGISLTHRDTEYRNGRPASELCTKTLKQTYSRKSWGSVKKAVIPNYRIPLTFRHHKPLRASGLRYIYRLPFDLIIVWNRSPYDWYRSSLPSPRLLAAQGDSSQAHSLRLVIRSRSLDGSLLPP